MVNDGDASDAPAPHGGAGLAVRSAMLWNLAQHGVSQLVSAGVFLYLAAQLDSVVFGVFALATLVVDAFAVEARTAAVDLVVAGRHYSAAALATIYRALLAAAGAAYLLTVGAGFGLQSALHAADLAAVTAVVGLNILIAPRLAIHEALAFRDLRFRALAWRNIAASLASAAAAVAAVALGAAAWALVAQKLVASLVGLATLARLTPWRPTAAFERARFPGFARVFGQLWLGQMVNFGLGRIPDLLVGVRLGTAELGLYRIAARLVDMAQSAVTSPLTGLFIPVLSRLAGDRPAQAEQFRQIAALSALLIVPALAGLALLSTDIVQTLLPAKPSEMGLLVALLAAAGLAAPFAHFRGGVLVAAGRPGLAAGLALLDLATTGAAVWLGAGAGLVWAAVGVTAASWVAAAISAAFTARVLSCSSGSILAACAPPYLAAAVMSAGLFAGGGWIASDWSSGLRLVAGVVAGAAIFVSYLGIAHPRWLRHRANYLRARGGAPET